MKYLIALGSNQRHSVYGPPHRIINAAFESLMAQNLEIQSTSSLVKSRAVGPSDRDYANAVAIIKTGLEPGKLLLLLKQIEEQFGSRRGQRWSKRVLDLDIILSSTGFFYEADPELCIPHKCFRHRDFVLLPASEIAADWRDPLTGLTIGHLAYRLKRPKPLDPQPNRY